MAAVHHQFMTTIYILELERGKYYVGRSKVPNHRIINHFCENGSGWTKLYKPIRVIFQIKGDEFDEEKYTLKTMEKYGIENTRGGSYCKIKLSSNDKNKALQTIRSITDKCYKCGLKGHFANVCYKTNNVANNLNKQSNVISDSKLIKHIENGYRKFIDNILLPSDYLLQELKEHFRLNII